MAELSDRRIRAERQERVLLSVVGNALGVAVCWWDTGGRQGAPDGRFERPATGEVGFVEVTMLADPAVMAGEAAYLGDRKSWSISGLSWSFIVTVDPTVNVDDFDRFMPDLCRGWERSGARFAGWPPEDAGPAAALWFRELTRDRRIDVHPSPETNRPGTIYALTGSRSLIGSVGNAPTVVEALLKVLVNDPTIIRRLEKLRRAGGDESHLVVTVTSGYDEPGSYLGFDDTLPTGVDGDRGALGDLSGLWLWSPWARKILKWESAGGWSWFPFPERHYTPAEPC